MAHTVTHAEKRDPFPDVYMFILEQMRKRKNKASNSEKFGDRAEFEAGATVSEKTEQEQFYHAPQNHPAS